MGDNAAAICVDGRLVAAVEEERISRRKYDGAFPYGAIDECLRISGLCLSDIDLVSVYWQPWRLLPRAIEVGRRVLAEGTAARATISRVLALFTSVGHERDADYPQLAGRWSDLFRLRQLLSERFGSFEARISFFDHHICHAVSGRILLPDEDALCLTYDGGGEVHSTVVGRFKGNKFTPLKQIRWPNSLGHYYSAFTGYMGFRIREDEYKMMGLASYGKPRYAGLIREYILSPAPEGDYSLNLKLVDYHAALIGRFSAHLIDLLGPARRPGEEISERHRDIAASVQAVFEERLLDLVAWARRQCPEVRQLILAGGCALNATANGKIVATGLFDRVVVPPGPHDAGGAIGAALLGAARCGVDCKLASTPYLGRSFDHVAIAAAFRAKALPVPRRLPMTDMIATAAGALAAGEVVGWFQGACEFGPRALGNRSFLADPRRTDMRERINAKIKHREMFRPFAPSVKAERAFEFFDLCQPSPYMNIACQVRPEKRTLLTAVTHVDGSARLHTVTRDANEIFWCLLDAFERQTGVPVLLNTSFNIQEPIVNTPGEAITTFLASHADKLFIGDFCCDSSWRAAVERS
jgi:Predicted carbamoyl transferase, NodU family